MDSSFSSDTVGLFEPSSSSTSLSSASSEDPSPSLSSCSPSSSSNIFIMPFRSGLKERGSSPFSSLSPVETVDFRLTSTFSRPANVSAPSVLKARSLSIWYLIRFSRGRIFSIAVFIVRRRSMHCSVASLSSSSSLESSSLSSSSSTLFSILSLSSIVKSIR